MTKRKIASYTPLGVIKVKKEKWAKFTIGIRTKRLPRGEYSAFVELGIADPVARGILTFHISKERYFSLDRNRLDVMLKKLLEVMRRGPEAHERDRQIKNILSETFANPA